MNVELNLEEKIRSELFKQEEELVEIELLEDIASFGPFLGISLNGTKAKSRIKIPRFIANYYVSNNKAKFVKNDVYISLLNSLKQQKPSFKLNVIPDNLLINSLIATGIVSTQKERKFLMKNENNIKLAQKTLSNLVTERVKRILRDLAINDYGSIEKDLDQLEKPLIRVISEYIQTFLEIINFNIK